MTAAANKPLRVLVVDDDELDRLAVRRCLQQTGIGFRAEYAASASVTRERVATDTYDCILLDYYLPGEDSMALLRDLRASVPATPIIIFTGRGDEDIAVELMKSGAADYLPKASLTPERLASAIRHAREMTQAAAARARAEGLLRLSGDAAQHLLTASTADGLMHGLFEKIREPLDIDAWFSYRLSGADLRMSSCGGIGDEDSRMVADVQIAATGAAGMEPLEAVVVQAEGDIARRITPLGLRACSCQPLFGKQRLLGVLCFASRTRDSFTDDETDFFRTISRYAMAACERLQHIDEMRESDQRKDEFLATLAHELRDPLAPLSNVLEMLKLSSGNNSVLEQARDTMERQLGQLVQLVDDLLDMSRITRSRLDLRKRRVDLQSVVQQAVETVRPLAESLGHTLEVSLPPEPVYLHADPVRMAQVFGNLLSNACKYTERPGNIELAAEAGSDLVVTVRDSGIGIPPERLTTVFEMFSQVPSARKLSQGGLGIGLTLVRRLVAMHGGSVEARSEGPGRGSEFIVNLPVAGQTSELSPACGGGPEVPVAKPRRILIVDDNRDSAASLAMLLGMAGNAVREAYDGIGALEAAVEFRPDLILLDIGLPKMNGFEVCRRVRAESWGRDILVVALSGWGQEGDRQKSREAGFDHHLVKPVKYSELTNLLSVPEPAQPSAGGAVDA